MFNVEDSSTYWLIYNRGWIMGYVGSRTRGAAKSLAACPAEDRVEVAREIVSSLGRERLHTAPTPSQTASLASLSDIDRLERIIRRLPGAESWDDLLPTP